MAITGAGGGLGSLAIQYAKAMGFRVRMTTLDNFVQEATKNVFYF